MANRTAVAALSLSAAALVGIVVHEGYSDTPYFDSVGVPTIGFGTTHGVKPTDRTTPPKALARALSDIQQFEGALKRCVKVPLHQHEYDAFLSLAYNIGPGAFCNSTLVRKLNAGDYAGACEAIDSWVYSGGKRLAGLVKRRAIERAMCEGRGDDRA